MSCTRSLAEGSCRDRLSLPAAPATELHLRGMWWRHLAGLVRTWIERSRQRDALRELDPHLLRDIGISPEQARAEAGKPFWRE